MPLTQEFGKFSRLKDKLYFGVKTMTKADCYRVLTTSMILISTFSYLGDTTDACLALKESPVESLTGFNRQDGTFSFDVNEAATAPTSVTFLDFYSAPFSFSPVISGTPPLATVLNPSNAP